MLIIKLHSLELFVKLEFTKLTINTCRLMFKFNCYIFTLTPFCVDFKSDLKSQRNIFRINSWFDTVKLLVTLIERFWLVNIKSNLPSSSCCCRHWFFFVSIFELILSNQSSFLSPSLIFSKQAIKMNKYETDKKHICMFCKSILTWSIVQVRQKSHKIE